MPRKLPPGVEVLPPDPRETSTVGPQTFSPMQIEEALGPTLSQNLELRKMAGLRGRPPKINEGRT